MDRKFSLAAQDQAEVVVGRMNWKGWIGANTHLLCVEDFVVQPASPRMIRHWFVQSRKLAGVDGESSALSTRAWASQSPGGRVCRASQVSLTPSLIESRGGVSPLLCGVHEQGGP